MKNLFLLLFVLAVGLDCYAQKKPKINQAEKSRMEGNLGEAKNIIDAAIEHEKTKIDGKTWYYRGLIYASLDTTSNSEYQNLATNPLQTAMAAFAKADEMQKGNSEYYISDANGLPQLKTQQIQTLWGFYLNKGVEAYQADKKEEALVWLDKTKVVQPEDTTGYIYAGSIALSAQNYEAAAENYYALIDDLDYQTKDAYNSLIYIESSVNKDDNKAIEVIRRAKDEFPDDLDFAKSEVAALIRLGKSDEAKVGLKEAISKEPNNAALHFQLGILEEELGNTEAAKAAYTKSNEIDPNYYNAAFNLAVLYYNEAVNLITEQNNLGISSDDLEKAKKMQVEIDDRLKKAMPYWEKVLELKPDERTALETLQYIYMQEKEYDKAEEMKTRLEALGEENGE
ncbi:MAG: tetratricopeptide repeat protein [Bacteroidota bacterium]